MQPGTKSVRTVAAWVGRLALTGLLLWWIFSREEVRAGMTETRFVHPWWLLGAVAAGVVASVLAAARWQACLRASECVLPFEYVLRTQLSGNAVGLLSIGALGIDATRFALTVRRLPARTASVAAAIALDHIVPIPTMLVGGIAIVLSMGLATTIERSTAQMIALAVAGIAAVAVAVRAFLPAFHFRVMAYIGQVARSRQTALAALLATPMLIAYYGVFFCVARALGIGAPMGGLAGVIVISDTVASLPVTIAGLGFREKSFEILLDKWYHVPHAQAVMASLSGFGVLAAVAVIGALLLPVRREPAQ